jgi:D-sedoheptulose 7-phosphate isomerase
MKPAVQKVDMAETYFWEVKRLLDVIHQPAESFVEALFEAYNDDRAVFIIGNGGSASNASHLGQDLSKGTLSENSSARRLRALSLTDNMSYITAVANDEGFEFVFVRQLMNFARKNDVLLAISCSGNSPNIVKAVEYGKSHGLKSIAVTGFSGGRLGQLADLHLNVPSDDYGLVEAVHAVVFHLAVWQLRQRLEELS